MGSKVYRLKKTFTAGELSPLLYGRTDYKRYANGCQILKNMFCHTQGPAARRPGFEFIYDLNSIYLDTDDPVVRLVPFIFSETQSYALIFYNYKNGATSEVRVVFAYQGEGLVTDGSSNIVYVSMPTGWDIEAFDWAQTADEMYFTQSGLKPHTLVRSSHTSWTVNALTFTSQPSDWSDTNGWPERVTFHQQRLVFAANTLKGQTIWTSKAGDLLDFDGTGSTDDVAITFTLDSGTQNKIQWIQSNKALIVGTIGDEWTVTGATQNALTPSNILAKRQTNKGSEAKKPLIVNQSTVYMAKYGRTINEFIYDYSYDSYRNYDISILAPHLTDDYSLIDWSYQDTPDSIIWGVRDDGDLIGCTFQREHKVIGWHHHDTQGEFKAVTVTPGSTREDDVWAIVKRTLDTTDHWYLERLADWFIGSDPDEGRFLDSFITYDGTPASTFTGAAHLNGLSCSVLADGAVHPNVTVSGGSFTLNKEYSKVVIGLAYTSEIRPEVAELSLEDGTSVGRIQQIIALELSLYRSLGCIFGIVNSEDGAKEEEQPFRYPYDILDSDLALFTGIYHIDSIEGYDRKTVYYLKQEQPLPLTVLSITDIVEVYD